MKIAIFSDNFYPEISGISDSIIITAKELAKMGHKINFYVPKHPEKNFKKLNLPFKELKLHKNIKIIRIPSLPFPTGTGQGRLVLSFNKKIIKNIREFKPDIIHTHLPFGVGIIALKASKKLNIPIVGTNHTPIKEFIRYSPIKIKSINNYIIKYNTKYFNKCNFISSPCSQIFEEIKEKNIKPKHEPIPNPVEIKVNRKKLKKTGGNFDILYSGRIAEEKNIDIILKAMAKLKEKIPNIKLTITGKGTAEKNLRHLSEKLDIKNKVIFKGFLSEDKLQKTYQKTDIFIIMSTAETQCLAAMKAMKIGIPIIGSKSYGLKDYINKNNGILIKPGDYNKLAKKIYYLYKNPEIRNKLGKGGREFVKNFHPKKIADKWEQIYKETIKKHKIKP